MVQAKISSFFKTHCDPPQISDSINEKGEIFGKNNLNPESLVTYKRRQDPNPNSISDDDVPQSDDTEVERVNESTRKTSSGSNSFGKVLNKKRNYSQFHLELGQSDFLLHTCSICGLMYARGDEVDEKVHKSFHKDYYQGIQFKGWRNERVVFACQSNGDRIVLVLDDDSPVHKLKVHQVVRIMEKELGFCDGKLLHKLCQVYMFISNHKIVGCLISEPIKTAHRVITGSDDNRKVTSDKDKGAKRLQFGSVVLQREVIREGNSANRLTMNTQCDNGAMLCEEESAPAFCGIRAIWVAPCSRRNRIASKLLDATRKSFYEGHELEISQCAFSSPTSAGKALASSYSGTKSFLIYKTSNV